MMNADTLRAAPHTLHTPRLRLEHPRAEHAAAVMDSVNASLTELRYIGWGQTAFGAQRALRFCEHDRELVAAGECLIEARCDARNLRSIRFAEQLGMQREGRLRSHARDPEGCLCHDVVLALRRDDPQPSIRSGR